MEMGTGMGKRSWMLESEDTELLMRIGGRLVMKIMILI